MKKKEKARKKGRRYQLMAVLIVLIILAAVFSGWLLVKKGFTILELKKEPEAQTNVQTEEDQGDGEEILSERNNEKEADTDRSEDDAGDVTIKEETVSDQKTPTKIGKMELMVNLHPENTEVFEGGKCTFHCFSEEASKSGLYEWQRYSKEKREWKTIGIIDYTGKTSELDEDVALSLNEKEGNKQSVLTIRESVTEENDSLIRCMVYDDTEKKQHCIVSQPAVMRVIDKDFVDLLINYSTICEAGTTISTNDIRVGFRYADGSVIFASQTPENLHFLEDKVVKKDVKDNSDGSITESTTTSAIEKETYKIELGENNITMRCRLDDKITEGIFDVKGVDYISPELIEVATSEVSAGHGDKESLVAFALKGSDNYTPEEELLYALAEKDTPVTDSDYSTENMYAEQAQEGAVYVAYVKDSCGNVGTKEVTVNIKDDVMPVIDAIELEHPDQSVYCQLNKISVKAHDDQSELTYRYTWYAPDVFDDDEGIETGKGAWRGESFYQANKNGRYLIEVRDRGGNIASQTVEIKNIDNIAPVIKAISSFAKVEVPGCTGVIIGHDLNGMPIYGSDGSITGVIAFNYRGIPIYVSASEDSDSLIGYDIYGKEIHGSLQEGSSSGTSGNTGDSGSSGTSGKTDNSTAFGTSGKNGENGKDGLNGKDGVDGKDGINGRDGMDGADGSDGRDGEDGKDGRDGRDGNSSFFAYADNVNGSVIKNFHRDTPLPTSKWIGVYSGTSAPSSQSQYTWSQYKTANSVEFIKDQNIVRITINPAGS